MQSSENKKFIDIDEVFKSKNPGLYKMLPGFVIRYLKKITHQEEINDFIYRHGHKTEFDFVDAIVEEFGAKCQVVGEENIPETGGFIIASNHPLGGLDAMTLLDTVGRKRRDIRFVVNDILLQLKNLKGIFIGVNKHGRNIQDLFAGLDELYASGHGVLIFPAGLVSRKQNGIVRDLEWKKSFVTKAKKHNLPVIPVFIGGKNSEYFYNLSSFRGKIGIKANIEMLYLPDEMYKQKNKTITIIFGKPILPDFFNSGQNDKFWANQVKEQVYKLEIEGQKSSVKEES